MNEKYFLHSHNLLTCKFCQFGGLSTIGIFLCSKCHGKRQSLDTHICFCFTCTVPDEEIQSIIKVGGNFSANSIFEASILDGISKPGADSSHERCYKFIRCVNFPGAITC
ncbi:hypothetical protein MKW92_012154 [Papaver armeniacum]|nr:hypothetical protein MKW92_012154 [Papaver armeniacum]